MLWWSIGLGTLWVTLAAAASVWIGHVISHTKLEESAAEMRREDKHGAGPYSSRRSVTGTRRGLSAAEVLRARQPGATTAQSGTPMLNRPHSALERSAARAFDAEVSAAMSAPTRTVPAPRPPNTRYHPDDTLDSIDTFRGLLRSHSTIESLLQGLCERVAAVVPGADMVGVTLMPDNLDRPATVACSDARVIAIDSGQYSANEGPGLEAARTGRIVCVRVDDVRLRWPTFAANAADIGVRSYLSAPLKVESAHAGSLNLYGFDEDGFTDIDEVTVAMFVTAAETSIWNTRRTADALTEVEGLRTAMLTRATIEQAKGILMAVRAISPEAAFTALAEQSQRENTRISVLATRIVATVMDGHRESR